VRAADIGAERAVRKGRRRGRSVVVGEGERRWRWWGERRWFVREVRRLERVGWREGGGVVRQGR